MTWAKLDDQILQNPKLAQCGGMGFAVHAAGIVYCCQNLTDGFVPYGVAIGLLNLDGVGLLNGMQGQDATVLCIVREGVPGYRSLQDAELWVWDEDKRGWWLHNFLEWNPSRETVLAEREKNRERMKFARGARGVRANNGRTPDDVQEQLTRSARNPVPVPVPVPSSSSSRCGKPSTAKAVDDDVQHIYDEVMSHVAAVRMRGQTVSNPAAYRAKVIEGLIAEHGDRLRRVILTHPSAPVNVLAGYVLEEPTPSLQQYRVTA